MYDNSCISYSICILIFIFIAKSTEYTNWRWKRHARHAVCLMAVAWLILVCVVHRCKSLQQMCWPPHVYALSRSKESSSRQVIGCCLHCRWHTPPPLLDTSVVFIRVEELCATLCYQIWPLRLFTLQIARLIHHILLSAHIHVGELKNLSEIKSWKCTMM